MKAEIITIGDEILIGQIVDTNSQWMGVELNKIGIHVYQITSIQDDKQHILKALKEASENADIVIVTGGLGPTKDDITKHTFATFFEDTLVLNEAVVDHIKEMFSSRGIPFSELNRDQGLVPSKCTVLHNALGTAPGMWLEENNTVYVSLPGVPFEMKGLMTTSVLPKLQEKFTLPFIQHKTIMTYGMGESSLAETIAEWEDALPEHISLAYLPSPGTVKLRLSGTSFNKQELFDEIGKQVLALQEIIGDLIIGFDTGETIQAMIGKLLTEKGQTLSVAESCTGGMISQLLTENSGASQFFIGSLVAYHARLKIKELNVSEEIIKKYSVVSVEVAEAMAIGVQKKMGTDYAIATTGNAGPTADETDKTVGVVCIAIATPDGVFSEEFNFGRPREKVILRSSNKALELLRKEILKNY
ncbi:competence/damage-inducible protein A [Flavicella sediminum]|uniref:competence/damage-inducible protein A n=1 Tax=Flavicella sediminum TaxID=2585141 RepID=UPI001123FC73|nr:competence/damage-inducible protein A [Flavicella sediminum]